MAEVLRTAATLRSALNHKKKKGHRRVGSDLLSQGTAPQVPSALAGLTTGFGMGPGVPLPRKPPTKL